MKNFLLILIISFLPFLCFSQEGVNYDENKIPEYELPELLRFKNGNKVNNAKEWKSERRPEIIKLFEEEMFGIIPGKLNVFSAKVIEESENAVNGKAIRKQVRFTVKNSDTELFFDMLIFLPKSKSPAPVFVGYNFNGNHTVCSDPEILITKSWVRNNSLSGISDNKATEQSRGTSSSRWPIEKIIDAGYGVATIYYGDVDPDNNDFSDGIHPFLYKENQIKPEKHEWGSIAAWSWGLSRAMDYFETNDRIDADKVTVMGHSRLGKTSLWAGAMDQRFAAVISNNSGCGGAALSRRGIGETVERINTSFPHWFCDNFKKYNGNENKLPIDQHMLIAIMAPRPVYITSASEDKWADPKGEYLSGFYASAVYNLYGFKGLEDKEMPGINTPLMNRVGYHIREGGHDVTDYDWEQFIRFADKHLKN